MEESKTQNEKVDKEIFYKEKMWYYHEVLGIAHHHLTIMGIIFRNEDLSEEEKLAAIKKHVLDYKNERKEYHNEWALRFLPVSEDVNDSGI